MSFARRRTAKALAALFLTSCAALAATAQDTGHATTRTQARGATTGWQSPAPAAARLTTGWQ